MTMRTESCQEQCTVCVCNMSLIYVGSGFHCVRSECFTELNLGKPALYTF